MLYYSFKIIVFILAGFSFFSCSGSTSTNSNNSPLVSFAVIEDEGAINLRKGEEKKLLLQGIYKDGSTAVLNNDEAIYKIDDTSVASVDFKGEVRALKEGNATLKITYPKLNSAYLDVVITSELNTSNLNKPVFGNAYIS
jgi:hypothetical protein